MTKQYKQTTDFDDVVQRFLSDSDSQKEYLNISLEAYIKDGNFDAFFRSLELVLKAKNISEFAKKTNLNRANLYKLLNSKSSPKLETVAKILAELGYTLKIA